MLLYVAVLLFWLHLNRRPAVFSAHTVHCFEGVEVVVLYAFGCCLLHFCDSIEQLAVVLSADGFC